MDAFCCQLWRWLNNKYHLHTSIIAMVLKFYILKQMCEENNHLFDTFYAFHAQNKISVFKVKICRTFIHVKFITVKWGRLFCIFHAWHWGFAVVCSGLQWSCGVLITLAIVVYLHIVSSKTVNTMRNL